MMKLNENLRRLVLATMVVCGAGLLAEDKTQEQPKKEVTQPKKEAERPTKEEIFSAASIAKVSETYGHFIAKSLNNPIIQLNFDSVIKGMQEAHAGKTAPMTEQEYEEALSLMQEYAFKDMSEKNLKEANEFLAKNAKEKGVVELEKGKLQMVILKQGQGDVLTDDLIPVIHYTGKYLDGTSFGSSRDSGEPISINLKTAIPGFRQGLAGIKVGEIRKIFVHPDLGYGTSGQLLPNALLVFEVELVKLNPITKETLDEANDTDIDETDVDNEDDDSDEDDTDDGEEGSAEEAKTPAKKS